MDKQIYYEALDKNDHMPLEDLADQYDFNSVFNPLRSAFMLEDCDLIVENIGMIFIVISLQDLK